jgi:hypothetical protein
MFQKHLMRALPAVVLGVSLTSAVEAQTCVYPCTSGTTRTTVSGTYRPLNLSFEPLYGSYLLGGTSYSTGIDTSLAYDLQKVFEFTKNTAFKPVTPHTDDVAAYIGIMGGTYQAVGDNYVNSPDETPPSGSAGLWALVLDPNWLSSDFTVTETTSGGGGTEKGLATTVISAGVGQQAGFLVYLGDTSDNPFDQISALPAGDTPAAGDLFKLSTTATGDLFKFTWENVGGEQARFEVGLLQDLTHQGPYTPLNCSTGDWVRCAYLGLYNPAPDLLRESLCTSEYPCTIAKQQVLATSVVPLPGAAWLFGSALLGSFGWLRWGRRKALPA